MLNTLPLEFFLQIIMCVKYWKDIRSLKKTCKRLHSIIMKNKDLLFKKKLISNNFVEYDEDNQVNKKNRIIKISENLKFFVLPWKYQTNEIFFRRVRDYDNPQHALLCLDIEHLTKEICAYFIEDDAMAELFADHHKQNSRMLHICC